MKQAELFSKPSLRRLIVPLLIEQTLALTVGMFDIMMVSSVGESAVSGVSLVDSISILIIYLFAALATGGAIVVGQYMGRDEYDSGNKAARHLLLSALALALLVMGVCLLLNEQILRLVFGRVQPDVMANARTYFYVMAVCYPFIAVFNCCAALFRTMGNSRNAMINAFIMNALNIAGNALLIYGFDMGVLGAALATLFSRIVASASILIMLRGNKLPISLRSYSPRGLDFAMVKRILKIGIPNGIENSIFQIGKIIVTSLVAGLGTTAITAHAVANSLSGVQVIPAQAMSLAITTVVARCIGAGQPDQADIYLRRLMKQAHIWMAALNACVILALKPILGLYDLSDDTFTLAYQILVICGAAAVFFWPIAFSLPNAFRAAGDVRRPMVISILSMWIFRIGFSFLLVNTFHMGVLSVWISMIIDWVFRSICFVWLWRSGKWKLYSAI